MPAKITLSLTPLHMRKVKSILSGEVPDCDILAYGQRAVGAAKPKAYLDLAIVADKPLGKARMEEITNIFAKAGLPFPVALVDWADTGSSFRKEIKRTAVSLCSGKKTAKK